MDILLHRHEPRFARPHSLLLAALLCVATFIVYHPALHGDFLLDDDVHVTRPELRSAEGLGRIWTEIGATQQYYPVLHTAFWLEHRLWGDAVLGYHLINVLFHSVAALLVLAITRQLQLQGGWLAAFVFALHPVHVESVAWISEQKNTLSAVFYLGAALTFPGNVERRNFARYVLASALFAAALLSKTATATLPAALLVIRWWRHGRLDARRDVVPLLPWFGASLVAGTITVMVERNLISDIDANLSLTPLERVLVAGRAVWFYLGKIAWPSNLSFLYERWPLEARDAVQLVFPAASLVLAAVSIAWARRWRGPLAAMLFFGGTLAPVLGFVNVEWFVFSFVADHFVYLASLGVIVPLAAVTTAWVRPLSHSAQRLAMAGAVVVAGVLGILSARRSGVFRDSVSLYADSVARAPASVAAHYLLGVALAAQPPRSGEAVAAFEAALRLNPEAAEVHEKLGEVLLRMPGRAGDAVTHLETALRLKPGLAGLRAKLAAAWFDEARARAQSAGGEKDAEAAYERALQLDPASAETNFNLGNLLLRMAGRRDEAIAHFEAAVRLKPDFAEAHTNLGTALATQPGRLGDAIAHFEAALRANPDFAPARNNLARARALRQQ
jgi:cytochrome c-type biogenesis protein CcmH/NrfG